MNSLHYFEKHPPIWMKFASKWMHATKITTPNWSMQILGDLLGVEMERQFDGVLSFSSDHVDIIPETLEKISILLGDLGRAFGGTPLPDDCAASHTLGRVTFPASALKSVQPVSLPDARARVARRLLAQRRQRDLHFPGGLFFDPAWDMLLDLYAAHYERRDISVSSLCIAAAVPATTALRWISTMEGEGYFQRYKDECDGRRYFLRLSGGARRSMDEYFAASFSGEPRPAA